MEIFTRLIKRMQNIIREEIKKNDLNVKKKNEQNLVDGVVEALKIYKADKQRELIDKIAIQILY